MCRRHQVIPRGTGGLGINIIGEFAELALSSPAPYAWVSVAPSSWSATSPCLQRGAETRPGGKLAYSIVHNYLNRLVAGAIGDNLLPAAPPSDSVAAAFTECWARRSSCRRTAVLGAVGIAYCFEKAETTGTPTRFQGWDLDQVEYTVKEFTCKGCTNECDIRQFTIGGENLLGRQVLRSLPQTGQGGKQPVIPDRASASGCSSPTSPRTSG